MKAGLNCRVFGVTAFTRLQSREIPRVCPPLSISSRSLGVPCSQEKDRNREITVEKGERKAHLYYNFTWCSQNVNENLGEICASGSVRMSPETSLP